MKGLDPIGDSSKKFRAQIPAHVLFFQIWNPGHVHSQKLNKTNIAAVRRPPQEESHLPNPVFQVLKKFQGGVLR